MEEYLKLKVGDTVRLLGVNFAGLRTGETAKIISIRDAEHFSINSRPGAVCSSRPVYWEIVKREKRKKFFK